MQTQVSVSNTTIRQQNGLYSLNDLHRASGGEDRHAPRRWLSNQQTIDLINQVEIDEKPSIIKKQQLGTFACEELVVHYGMWISPAFSLKVIRCFLDKEKANQKLTPEQKQQIQAAVQQRHHRTGEHWQEIYKKLHEFCKVNSYHEIQAADFEKAMQFLEATPDTPARPYEIQGITFSELEISRFTTSLYMLDWATREMKEISRALIELGAREKGVQFKTMWAESQGWLRHSRQTIECAQPKMKDPVYRNHVSGSLERMKRLAIEY